MTAIIYKRVSTDEQAFGFSLTDQDKRLTEYCQKKGIEIAASFEDDYTGKTFNRPAFQNLLSFLKKNNGFKFSEQKKVNDVNTRNQNIARQTNGTIEQRISNPAGKDRNEIDSLDVTRTDRKQTGESGNAMEVGQERKITKVDQIIFTKWTRFSRDTTDALVMIRDLKNKGITVQAIDEPIDFANPFHKHMLNMCLTSGEVDNDMRTDNTIRGMRRGIKEGRYVSRAPQGYLNKRDEQGKPILAVDNNKAPLIREMFDLMSTGNYTQQEVRRIMAQKGLKYCRTKFTDALRNVTYIGKLNLPSYKGEQSEIVKGIHEPIIDETTFYRVQDVLNGKKRPKRYAVLSDEMPLRGFIYCASDHKMTGSCSKGHGGQYHYYHCANVNCERHRADLVNQSYVEFLESLKPKRQLFVDVFKETLEHFYKPDTTKTGSLQQQIRAQETRIQVLQDRLIDGTITSEDYSQIKARYESALFDLRNQLKAITQAESEFSTNFGNSIMLLSNLPEFYTKSSTQAKREIIGSITPSKLYFENGKVRTSEINEAVKLIATIDKGYSQSHVLQKVQYEGNATHGAPSGTLVRTLSSDLAVLSNLYKLVA